MNNTQSIIYSTILDYIVDDYQLNIGKLSMVESSTNLKSDLFNIRSTTSNQHLVFAETLRDWRDPLLQGYDPIPIALCSRCAICKCQSLKDFSNTALGSIHHHRHHQHDSSCPSFRHQHEHVKTSSQERTETKPKPRSLSHDPSKTVLNTSSIIKSKFTEHSPSLHSVQRTKSTSKIPVRTATPINDSSSLLSMNKIRSSNKTTKIPRLKVSPILPSSAAAPDDLYDIHR